MVVRAGDDLAETLGRTTDRWQKRSVPVLSTLLTAPARRDVNLEIIVICGQRVERVDVTPLSETGTETAAWKPSKIKAEKCPQSQGASLLGGERMGIRERRP